MHVLLFIYQVLFSDETYVDVGEARSQFVRRGVSERLRPLHTQSHRPFRQRVLFWGCFSASGLGPLVEVQGTLKTDNYVNILECNMLPHMTVLFPDGSGYFQQDNAPCHKSRKTVGWLAQKNVNVLDWPPYSPDLNPIENLWSIVKKRIQTVPRHSKAAVVSSTISEWNDSLNPICEELIASMPRRIAECIRNKGGPTSY